MDRINMLKYYIRDISLSSDFIVGFPGETDDDFSFTLDAMRAVEYDQIFSFVYSPRPYTPAAEIKDDIPLEVKKERLQELQNLQREIQLQKNKNDVGKKLSVLVDGYSKKDKNKLSGRSVSNKIVNFDGTSDWMNKIVELEIIDVSQNSLKGRIQ
jgi:tRNA-2-methylthio-N6-dimethylallyladenosine synthase